MTENMGAPPLTQGETEGVGELVIFWPAKFYSRRIDLPVAGVPVAGQENGHEIRWHLCQPLLLCSERRPTRINWMQPDIFIL